MTVLDIVILAVVAACAIYGARQGLIRELSHIVAFVLGLFLAVKLHSTAAKILLYRLPSDTALITAFFGLLLLVLIAVYLAFSYVKSTADKLKIGPADHVAGAVIGALQGAFVCALIIFLLVNFSSALPQTYLQNSRVASFLLNRSTAVSGMVPDSYVSRFMNIFGNKLNPVRGTGAEKKEQEDSKALNKTLPERAFQPAPGPACRNPVTNIHGSVVK